MTSDKPQSQSLSLPFCKMGHTSHHEALNSQLLILLCVGTDPRSFLTLGPVSFGSGWPLIQVHILSTFSRPLARPMNLAIQLRRVCDLSHEAHSGTRGEATLLWVWSQDFSWDCD